MREHVAKAGTVYMAHGNIKLRYVSSSYPSEPSPRNNMMSYQFPSAIHTLRLLGQTCPYRPE